MRARWVLAMATAALCALPASASAFDRSDLRPLITNSTGRIVDDLGREVRLRGVNVNALAEYWKGTAFPTTFALAKDDPEMMQRAGFNAVRLLISWSRVEPSPGSYSAAYLDRVVATARRLTARGMHVIVDFHQDAWGPTLVARPGEVCPEGSEPALGWDGAPGWATLVADTTARCAAGGTREANPAVLEAWAAFWQDRPGPGGVGVRTRFTRAVAAVARRVKGERGISGIDVLNEPGALSPEQQTALSDLHQDAFTAVREAGFRGLVLIEPSVLWSALGKGAPPPIDGDLGLVYAPHIYTGGFTGGPITRAAFDVALKEAKTVSSSAPLPVFSGEWGADPSRAAYFSDHLDLQDATGVSSTLWTWRESCGDPHKVGDLRAGRVAKPWGFFAVDCKTNKVAAVRAPLLRAVSRPYVRSAPGRLTKVRWNGGIRTLTVEGIAPRRPKAPIELFVQGIGTGRGGRIDTASGTGTKKVEIVGRDGVRVTAAGGRWRLLVRGDG